MNISQKIINRLTQLKMNKSELARKTGYTPQFIGDLLAGDKRWNEDNLSRVCNVLGLKIEIAIDEQSATLDQAS